MTEQHGTPLPPVGDPAGGTISASIHSLEKRVGVWMRQVGAWAGRFQPQSFQRRVIWTALTLTSVAIIGVLVAALIWLVVWTIDQLQPVLIPLSVAGVLAYILDPIVEALSKKFSRRTASTLVVITLVLLLSGLLTLVIVPAVGETIDVFQRKDELQTKALEGWRSLKASLNVQIGGFMKDQDTDWVDAWLSKQGNINGIASTLGGWVTEQLAKVPSLLVWFVFPILIPFFLWYMLAHRDSISVHWHEWIPIRASSFKTELIETLTSIHQQLRPYFRGQMTVSLINATLTTVLMMIFGLKYALLIGSCMIFLGLLPMIGIAMCAVPAMLIAFLQFSDPAEQMRWGIDAVWAYPLIVLAVFVVVQQIDGWFVTPKIIGESTGLSDFEVILSIFFWSTLFGGFLGALSAVPLTSSLKVLHRRYIHQINLAAKETMHPEEVANPSEDSGT